MGSTSRRRTASNQSSTGKDVRKDHHSRVTERNCTIRIPAMVAAMIFHLTKVLNHDNHGQTIEWLLKNSGNAIRAATGTGAVPAQPSITTEADSISGDSDPSV